MNSGVSIVLESSGARIDPFYLGSKDENSVQGDAGTPVNVNALTFGYLAPDGAAGAAFPRQQSFFVAVDSRATGSAARAYGGKYVLRSWVDDVTPPSVHLTTTRVARQAGRRSWLQTLDSQSGGESDPRTVGCWAGTLVGDDGHTTRSAGSPSFPPPVRWRSSPARSRSRFVSADFQEAKNIDTVGPSIMPNTRFASAKVRVVSGTAVDWIAPTARAWRRSSSGSWSPQARRGI